MRASLIAALLLLAAATERSAPPLANQGLDHVMLWSGDIDRVTAAFAVMSAKSGW